MHSFNPILQTDYPDPDVIRVDDTYYMVSTTMYFMPGGAILKSYDLINWEIVTYIFDKLDDTPAERMEQELTRYGKGMWAASIRYHEGRFYVAFVSHQQPDTYLFTADSIYGPWTKSTIKGYYHDCSLLFDDDGRVFITYGNREIHLTELNADLTGPKEGGIDKIIVSETDDVILGHEGSHFYKINGKYYLFTVHWPKSTGIRTEACFCSDTVDGEYKGGDVLSDDCGFFGCGVAQGGIVDTPNGKWYGILFRDNGAVGRIPVLVPVTWQNDMPVFGVNGKIPSNFEVASSRPYYRYEPLYTSDDFVYDLDKDDHSKLKLQWQWNHQPDNERWRLLPEGGLAIRTGKLCANVTHARNCLTQRMMFPKCEAEVTVDCSNLREGDIAGLCALQGCYGLIGVMKSAGNYILVKMCHNDEGKATAIGMNDFLPAQPVDMVRLSGPVVTLCLKANFDDLQDKLDFFYQKDKHWVKFGASHDLKFRLDHFTGCRFGLFVYSTKTLGGEAVFKKFIYRYDRER